MVPKFMDFHPNLKLPAEAIQQLRDDTEAKKVDEFGVRQIDLYHNDQGHVFCLLEAPDEDAVRKHHEALGVACAEVHQVESFV